MTRVYLVDDHRIFLTGVQAELEDRYDVVGSSYDVDTAVDEIRSVKPDVVLVDVHMPGGGGVAVFGGWSHHVGWGHPDAAVPFLCDLGRPAHAVDHAPPRLILRVCGEAAARKMRLYAGRCPRGQAR